MGDEEGVERYLFIRATIVSPPTTLPGQILVDELNLSVPKLFNLQEISIKHSFFQHFRKLQHMAWMQLFLILCSTPSPWQNITHLDDGLLRVGRWVQKCMRTPFLRQLSNGILFPQLFTMHPHNWYENYCFIFVVMLALVHGGCCLKILSVILRKIQV